MSLARVTRKGQITIPKDVRDALGIKESDYIIVVMDGDKAILAPAHPNKLADLKGKLPATKSYPGTSRTRAVVGSELGRKAEAEQE